MARTYHRDSRGRFASGGGSGGGSGGRKAARLPAPVRRTVGSAPPKRRGLLLQRGAVASSKRKLAGMDPADQSIKGALSRRSQKGAVTRAQNQLKAAQQGGRVRLSGRGGVLRAGARKAAAPVARPQRQPLTMEQRKAKLLRVHGRAMERDLAKRKGIPIRQVRDILDAGSPAVVVKNVKKWIEKNRGSMAPKAKPSSRIVRPRNTNAAILKVRAQKLRDMRAKGAHYSEIVKHQIRTIEIRNNGLGLGVRRR